MKKYKIWLIILVLILVAFSGWRYYASTAWERELTVTYSNTQNLYDMIEDGVIDVYEITNNTNKTLKDVVLIFECTGVLYKWQYEKLLSEPLRPRETRKVEIRERVIELKSDREVTNFELVKIEYKK